MATKPKPKLYLTYDPEELSDHASVAREVAKADWEVTDAPTHLPKTSRSPVAKADAVLLLSGWTYSPQLELEWDEALNARIPCAAVLVDETALWPGDKVRTGSNSTRFAPFRDKLRLRAGGIGFKWEKESIGQIVQQRLASLREELTKQPGAKTFVAWDFTVDGLDLILSALEISPPKGEKLQIPCLTSQGTSGQILSDVIVPGILDNDRVLVVTDRPNANVAFELGLALGFGKQVALVHVGADVPKWLDESPMNGHVVQAATDVNDIRKTLEDPLRWYCPPKPPSVPQYGGTMFLCPSRYLGAALREEQQRTIEEGAWVSPTTTSDLATLNKRHSQFSQVVWSIAPYTEGSDLRDGAENAANGIIAGWFFARAFQTFGEGAKDRVLVLRHEKSREVRDVQPISKRFKNLEEYATLLRKVRDQLPTVELVSGIRKIGKPNYELAEIPGFPGRPGTLIWMGVAPVRNREYEAFCHDTNSRLPTHIREQTYSPDAPVTDISAEEAKKYCRWLAPNCELPDAELWRYCARAGKQERYWWGEDSSPLARVSWNRANSGNVPHEVGKKEANTWGLCDMFGNVDEWTDPYEETIEDERSPQVGRKLWKALVVGGAYDMAIASFIQDRVRDPHRSYTNVGFRCVLFE